MGAEWVCPFDIDEAWLPCIPHRITQALATVPDTILVAQACEPDPLGYDRRRHGRPGPHVADALAQPQRLPLGKVACRVLPGLTIGHGNHSARYDGVRHIPTVHDVIESAALPLPDRRPVRQAGTARVADAAQLRASAVSRRAHVGVRRPAGPGRAGRAARLVQRSHAVRPSGDQPRRAGLRPVAAAVPVSVVIPVGDEDDEWRRRARNWIVRRYATQHPGWEVVLGYCGQPWSKGAALSDGVGRATGDSLVLADADSYVSSISLQRAAHIVDADPGQWVVPHDQVFRLTEDETARVYAGHRPTAETISRDRATTGPRVAASPSSPGRHGMR